MFVMLLALLSDPLMQVGLKTNLQGGKPIGDVDQQFGLGLKYFFDVHNF